MLRDFDYIDLGRIRMPSYTVPVTIKSLVFSEDAQRRPPARSASITMTITIMVMPMLTAHDHLAIIITATITTMATVTFAMWCTDHAAAGHRSCSLPRLTARKRAGGRWVTHGAPLFGVPARYTLPASGGGDAWHQALSEDDYATAGSLTMTEAVGRLGTLPHAEPRAGDSIPAGS